MQRSLIVLILLAFAGQSVAAAATLCCQWSASSSNTSVTADQGQAELDAPCHQEAQTSSDEMAPLAGTVEHTSCECAVGGCDSLPTLPDSAVLLQFTFVETDSGFVPSRTDIQTGFPTSPFRPPLG